MAASLSRRARVATVAVATALVIAVVSIRQPTAADVAVDGTFVRDVQVEVVDRLFHPEDGSAPLRLVRKVTVRGGEFFGTSFGPFVRFVLDDGSHVDAPLVVLQDDETVLAWAPEGVTGAVRIHVTNPDGKTASLLTSM